MTSCYKDNCRFVGKGTNAGFCIAPKRLASGKGLERIKNRDVSGEYDCIFFEVIP